MSFAKIILFGEHSVVYGNKAIGLKFKNLKMFSKISKKKSLEDEHVIYIKNILKKEYAINKEIYFKINSNIPISSGLGSSCSLAISMAKTFSKYFNIKVDIEKIAYLAEKKAHGNPSGIDAKILLSKNPVIFSKSLSYNIDIKLNSYLLIVYTGISSNTKEAINLVYNHPNKDEIINKISEITEKAITEIRNKNIINIGKLMNENQRELEKLNLSNDKINSIIKKCSKYCLGSKITGAGLGGSIIFLVKDIKNIKNIYEILKNDEVKIWNMDI